MKNWMLVLNLARATYLLRDGKLVATFTVHALPVKEFIEPAEQVGPRLRGCIVSIAMDNSAALISLEEMNW